MKTIAYQGIAGSFSHATARRLFGSSAEYAGFPSFDLAYREVQRGAADAAVLPIENTLAGMIFETVDLLIDGSLSISAETKTQIELTLLCTASTPLANIRKVYSHPKALAQCKRFFEEHPWIEPILHYDTAGAAADLAKMSDPSCAALASSQAAAIYGLEILREHLEDHKQNFTRFFVLSKEPASQGRKSSLCFTAEHAPGSLSRMLGSFADRGINLNCLVSRPWVGRPFEYRFYADFERAEPFCPEDLKIDNVKLLGIYDAV